MMMKTVFLIRHAETEKSRNGLADADRNLTKNGLADCQLMAERLLKRNLSPDLIISSPAVRAVQTAEVFAGLFDYETAAIAKEPILYESYDIESFVRIINQIDNQIDTVFLIGHNPTFTQLAGYILGGIEYSMKKTGIIGLNFEFGSWAEVAEKTGRIMFYDTPQGQII
jgi:phosphohistidine phosphatase